MVKVVLLLSHGQATVERGFSVNKQVHVIAAAGARQKYLHYLEEQERTWKKKETTSRKRKLEDDLEGEKQKKKCLLQDISRMEKSANHLAQQAEDTRKITLCSVQQFATWCD